MNARDSFERVLVQVCWIEGPRRWGEYVEAMDELLGSLVATFAEFSHGHSIEGDGLASRRGFDERR